MLWLAGVFRMVFGDDAQALANLQEWDEDTGTSLSRFFFVSPRSILIRSIIAGRLAKQIYGGRGNAKRFYRKGKTEEDKLSVGQ